MKKNVKIRIAKHAGFCFGVKRAIEIAERELKNKKRIFCLGNLIHNVRVVKNLEIKGLKICNDINEIPPNSFLLIRSHGLDVRIVKKAEELKIKIIDATCPFVKKVQEAAEDFYKKKFQVIIIGDYSHPEVLAVNSYTNDQSIVIKDEKEVKKLGRFSKCGIVIQTTKKVDLLKKISMEMLDHAKNVSISNTVCQDSFSKKEEIKKMIKNADVMIVIGDKKSNNTKELAEISRSAGIKTFKIEASSGLRKKWFRGTKNIGIAAGASTPKISIDEVNEKIRKILSQL